MFKPTKGQVETFLHLVRFATQFPESHKVREDGMYRWLASFCRSFSPDEKLSPEEWKILCEMPVVELFKLLDK